MFDVTGLEIVVLVGAASFLLGKKEVPQLARIVGRGTGKMVALLNTAREQFTKATQDTQFSKLTDEVRQNMYELDSIRSEVRAAGLQQQPGRLRRPGMPATGTPAAGGIDPALSKTHGDIFSASAIPSSYTLPTGGLAPGMKSSRNASSSTSSSSNKKLGELAMAELLWQESAFVEGKGGRTTHTTQQQQQQQQQRQASTPNPQTGSDMLEDVILETLLRDHADRFSSAQQQQGQNRSSEPPPPDREVK